MENPEEKKNIYIYNKDNNSTNHHKHQCIGRLYINATYIVWGEYILILNAVMQILYAGPRKAQAVFVSAVKKIGKTMHTMLAIQDGLKIQSNDKLFAMHEKVEKAKNHFECNARKCRKTEMK